MTPPLSFAAPVSTDRNTASSALIFVTIAYALFGAAGFFAAASIQML